jgi:hypothetical protein
MVRDKETGFMARLLATPTSRGNLLTAIRQYADSSYLPDNNFYSAGNCLRHDSCRQYGTGFLIFFLTAVCSISIGMIVAAWPKVKTRQSHCAG